MALYMLRWTAGILSTVTLFLMICLAFDIFHLRSLLYQNEQTYGPAYTKEDFQTIRTNHTRTTKESVDEQGFVLAFAFFEQFSNALKNLLSLAAFAKTVNRKVVVPYVMESKFVGVKQGVHTKPLSQYLDVNEFNKKLFEVNYSTLVKWETFHRRCNGKLQLLVKVLYDIDDSEEVINYEFNRSGVVTVKCPFSELQTNLRGMQVEKRACIHPKALEFPEVLEKQLFKGCTCLGFTRWRASLPPGKRKKLSKTDVDFFNETLKQIAQDFVAKKLGDNFISVHIRSESVMKSSEGNLTVLKSCFDMLGWQVKTAKNQSQMKVFLATDFSEFGSDSPAGLPARKRAKSLYGYLNKTLVQPIAFDPSRYNLSDRASIAIIEANILASGQQVFFLGGRGFQMWVESLFLKQNNNATDQVFYICIYRNGNLIKVPGHKNKGD